MAYLDMFILLNRYVFVGFMIVFIYISASFVYNMPDKLSVLDQQKARMQYICIFFFNLAGYALLVAKQTELLIQGELIRNGVIFILLVTITGWLLRLTKRSREIPLYNIILFLMNIGILMLERLNHREASKQVIWSVLGITCALFIPRLLKFFIHPRFKLIYAIVGWIFIITPFFLGKTKNGANNWIMFGEGEGAFGFQPSEIVKILLVLYLSSALFTPDQKKTNYRRLLVPILMAAGYILSLVIQRDLGGGLLYFLTSLTMVYVATNNLAIYLSGIGSGAMAAMIGYKLFAHVRVRVEAWHDPWRDISGKGYQIVQGLFAMGTWGWFGSGLTRGQPNKIPIVTSDFIFAAIAEEFGNLFAIGIILLYLLLILHGIKIILRVNNRFLILVGIGLINMIGIQIILIIGGVIKLIPLTGVTLPFISYGGSSMVVSLFMIGLLQYIADHMGAKIEKDPKKSAWENLYE